jgi:hypothetical protein
VIVLRWPFLRIVLRLITMIHNEPGRKESEVKMVTAKDKVRKLLQTVPDEATFDDIQYSIYVRQKIERGLEDVRQGRVLSQKEVERRMAQWKSEP